MATPEEHHTRLMAEIEHEIRTYGVASLAEIIAGTIDGMACVSEADEATPPPREQHYIAARKAYEDFAERLASLRRPFALPDREGMTEEVIRGQ